jgi:protein-tyrosine-phosphatase/DNA-binding transcriptional ArsR family regulator
MEKQLATTVFESLASGVRLDIFRLLVKVGPRGLVAGEIASALNLPSTNLSFHLKALSHATLVTVVQEGRFQRYRANLPLMQDLIAYLTAECCSGQPQLCTDIFPPVTAFTTRGSTMANKVFNVLFLCTHNSARSILAEAILNHIGQGRFKAYSAGSSPRDNEQPNPLSLQVLQHAGMSVEGLRSKSWDEFGASDAPHMDLVITVCDDAAGEVCPHWPGQPATAHWSYPAPSAVEGTEAQKLEAFRQTLLALKRRLDLLISLPDAMLERAMLQDTARNMAKGP